MKKVWNGITSWPVVLSVQAVASVMFVLNLIKLGALPQKYLWVLIAGVVLLGAAIGFLMKPSKEEGKGKIRQIIGKVLSIGLSIVFFMGASYVKQGTEVIEEVTGASEQTNHFSLLVSEDSTYTDVTDLAFRMVGMSPEYDTEAHFTEAQNALIAENLDIRITEYASYAALIEALYQGELDGIYVNEGYNGLFEEDYPTFLEDFKSIWSYDIVEQIIDITKKVDVTNRTFTVFISGIDTSGKVSTVSRSDVNMLVTVNPVTKDILMVSIPRDYYVTLANKGKADKLTHAGLGGVENSVKTIENFMGIDINYYMRVNFTSLVKIVDALGGITVESPVAFTTRHNSFQVVEGLNEMNGEQALGFVRERYSLKGGDVDRAMNQQRVLSAMLKKAMSPAILTNYSEIMESVQGSFETNISSEEIMNLMRMQLTDMASWNIHQTVLSGNGTRMTGGAYMPGSSLYYMIPDEESVREATTLIRKMISGEKISIE